MSFVTALALGITLLAAIPYFAHRLRRRQAEEHAFAPVRLVPAAPPKARRRAKLEDRSLFGIRILSIVALAALGASPLVRCSRLALDRAGGASVALALVLDDSMSMNAPFEGGTRFTKAKDGAKQLLASAREGDAVAVVLAGAPPRVLLAATTDLGAARAAIESALPSDRATDLEGALATARSLVAQLPQVDKRLVLLSDLADGHSTAAPLGQAAAQDTHALSTEPAAIPLWTPLAEIAAPLPDCAILRADRAGPHVTVAVACNPGGSPAGREVLLVAAHPSAGDGQSDKDKPANKDAEALARAAAPNSESGEITIDLPNAQTSDVIARLSGSDAIAADDEAPAVTLAGPSSIAVIADEAEEATATGGAPIVEQALAALRLDIAVHPLPEPPERADDLNDYVGVILDDPPGLTPEQRRAIGTFLQRGGVALLALGPRAAAAPLGASFEPILKHAVTWSESPVPGAADVTSASVFGESGASLVDLHPQGRALLTADDAESLDPLVRWKDGPPMIARRAIGEGDAWVITLPFSATTSDLPLRPAFLTLLDAWTAVARQRAAPRRGDVGSAWTFPGTGPSAVVGPEGPLPHVAGSAAVVPSRIGLYKLTVADRSETRVAAPVLSEIDLRPRATVSSHGGSTGAGDTHAQVDISWIVALILLGLLAGELALRAFAPTTPLRQPE